MVAPENKKQPKGIKKDHKGCAETVGRENHTKSENTRLFELKHVCP